MIDARIPLGVQSPNISNAIMRADQHQAQMQSAAGRNRLLDLRTQAQEGQLQDQQGQRELKSIARGAVDTLAYLQNNDVQGLSQYYQGRLNDIASRGGNPEHTQEAMDLLQSGQTHLLAQRAQQAVSSAKQLGILPNPAGNSFSKDFQVAEDASGNRVFIQGSSGGGARQLDGFKPVDPLQQKLREESAIQTQTPRGIATTEKAVADAEASRVKAESQRRKDEQQVTKGRQIKTTALNLVEDLLGDLNSTLSQFGAIDAFRPNVSQNAHNAAARLEQLESVLTSNNLDLMTGVLSESDIRIIRNISAGGLNRKLGDAEALKNLRELQSILQGELGIEPQAEVSNLSDDDLLNF